MSPSSLIDHNLDYLAGWALWEAELALDPACAALAPDSAEVESALLRRLSQVPDRRDRRGRRHPLVAVLVLAACATLVAGGDSVTAIWQWAARSSQDKLRRIGARRDPLTGCFVVPSERTFRHVLQTLDALHTTKKTARLVTGTLHAHYVLVLKGNQPLARAAAQRVLAGPDAEWSQTTHVWDERGHGRTERRGIRTAPADEGLFPGARQVFRLRRDVGGSGPD